MVKPITKYVRRVEVPGLIKDYLDEALRFARKGKPGPVWLEIPLAVQGSDLIPIKLIAKKLKKAKHPLMLIGNGIRLAGGIGILHKVIKKLGIAVASAMFTADDLVTCDYPFYVGCQGVYGGSTANDAIDNCDLLLIIGTRMPILQTSYDYENFATQAFKIMVDIDPLALNKKTLKIDIPVCCDAKYFLEELYGCL